MATGSIRRRRDDLVSRVVVCWLYSNSHDTEAHHLGDAIRGRLHLRHEDIQIVKHYPEQFLIIFSEPAYKEHLLDRAPSPRGGRDFHFAPGTSAGAPPITPGSSASRYALKASLCIARLKR
jgi:hypothetical protein